MTDDSARARANRRNARKSTGPSSPAGKQRAAQNARQHGLSLPIASDPGFAAEVAAFTRAIAGPLADAGRLARAMRVAEAEIDLKRIRACRDHLLTAPLAPRRPDLVAQLREIPAHDVEERLRAIAVWQDGPSQPPDPIPPNVCEAIAHRAKAIRALERYERRALSRRKAAIRQFDAAGPDEAGPGDVS
jgi:hypothetical protein